jgi:hypothetical protein
VIVYIYEIRIGETVKMSINEVLTYFRELSKRVEEIETNEEN